MGLITDTDLYVRGAETMAASWEEYARGATGAALQRLPGVSVGVFPHEPERTVYNNALLERDLAGGARASALDAMEHAYASAGVTRFAAWVHESDEGMRDDLGGRGFTLTESTRAMGMALSELRVPRPQLDLAPPDWPVYVEHLGNTGAPEGLLRAADPSAFHLLLACAGGAIVSTGLAFDLAGDTGIYNVETLEQQRRRGLGTAVTALLAHDAAERGCRTASLQSTEVAERVYAAVGFRDLGLILEYGP
jgi:ribosomal protein S18 acetylase RimI-like enzyme